MPEKVVLISGTGPVRVAITSGQKVITLDGGGLEVKTAIHQAINTASGGEILVSAAVHGVRLRSVTGVHYIGGVTNKPYSGFGYILNSGETLPLQVENVGYIRACAHTSGVFITWIGVV